MCEIAVIDPEQFPIEGALNLTSVFHEEQGDGVGVMAVEHTPDGFEYNKYKSTEPHWQTLHSFLKRTWDDAWRYVIHGRAKTSGKVNRETAHPIEIDCSVCDFDWVVHNGSVRSYKQKRKRLKEGNHSFTTDVDTEVIAHTIHELPDSIANHRGNTYSLHGNLSYLLFSEDGILVQVEEKYQLSDDFTMTCSPDRFATPENLGFSKGSTNEWMLITPDDVENGPEISTKERTTYTVETGNGRGAYRGDPSVNRFSGTPGEAGSWDDEEEVDDGPKERHGIVYDNLCEFDEVVAVRVAPGVLKVIDERSDNSMYVYRWQEPELYYWYSPEAEPDNIDELSEAADLVREKGVFQLAQEYMELVESDSGSGTDVVTEAVYEEFATTVASEVEDVTVADLAEVKGELTDSIEIGADAATEVAT